MPHLWRMNKDQIFHLSPVVGSILAGTIFGAWIWQYWGSSEGYIWGKPLPRKVLTMEQPKKQAEEKNPDSLYANPDEDEQQQINGTKHYSTK